MTKSKDYQAWKLKKLANPVFAAHYLNEVEKSSPELVLTAIQNVVRAREVSAVAREANIAREHIYRAFTADGNPTYATFRDVLKAVGVRFHFEPMKEFASPAVASNAVPHGGGLNSSPTTRQIPESLAMGSLGEGDLGGPRLAYINPNPPQHLGGIDQQRKPLRSTYGRDQEPISANR